MDSVDDTIIDNEIDENNDFPLGDINDDEDWWNKNQHLFDNQDDSEIISLLSNKKSMNLFGAGNKSQYFPNVIDYKSQIGTNIHKQRYGTCFAEAATLLIEQWLWLRFGKQIKFSREEIEDLAGDTKGSTRTKRKNDKDAAISGGRAPTALKYAYYYNDNLKLHYYTNQIRSENFDLFKQAIDYTYGGITGAFHHFTGTKIDNMNMDYVRKMLLWYGPSCWRCMWSNGASGGHALVIYKADSKSLTVRNSHGTSNTDKRFVVKSADKNKEDYELDKSLKDGRIGLDVTFSNALRKLH